MLILGIDTSARQASVALLRALEAGVPPQTIEVVSLAECRASEVLVPALDALLARHGVAKSSLGLVGVASGPGSFTGLRVALATAKGLAEAFDISVIAVSVLEALALAAGVEGRVVAALDAQRNELFFGEYLLDSTAAYPSQRVREGIAQVGGFASELSAVPGSVPEVSMPDRMRVFTPDEALAGRLREAKAGLDATVVARPTAEAIARIAYTKFLAGVRDDTATLDANYLRRSDAEIGFTRKPGGGSERR